MPSLEEPEVLPVIEPPFMLNVPFAYTPPAPFFSPVQPVIVALSFIVNMPFVPTSTPPALFVSFTPLILEPVQPLTDEVPFIVTSPDET